MLADQFRQGLADRPCGSVGDLVLDRARSIERRRRQAASGAMPPAIASRFTTGEAAALAVIGREAQRAGRCALFIDAIAALAGTCRSVVQSATREAARLGLIKVTERRIPGRKSLSNLVEVISPEWRAWLAIGFRKTNTTGSGHESALYAPFTRTKTEFRERKSMRAVPPPRTSWANRPARSQDVDAGVFSLRG
jgi:hypothetical protein